MASRYQFTTPEGYVACPAIEAPTGREAADRARSRTGRDDLLYTHLSDDHPFPGGLDPIFSCGPDYCV